MEAISISGLIGFALGYLVCGLLLARRDDDGEE